MTCTNCGGTEFGEHMAWSGSKFVGGSVRCVACGNIQSETAAPAPATPRRRTAASTEAPANG